MEFIGDLERLFASSIYPNRVPIAIGAAAGLIVLLLVARWRRWDLAARRHPRIAITGLLTLLLAGGPIGWYLGSPLIVSTSVDEPPPAVAVADPTPAPPSVAPSATPSVASSAAPEPVSPVRSGQFTGADEFHFGRGTAILVPTENARHVVRLEDFAVRNGPDLYVYLSPSPDGYADGAVELGRLKADRGNQNYDVPAGVNVGKYNSVVIWCRQFSVQFAAAPLSESSG